MAIVPLKVIQGHHFRGANRKCACDFLY